MKMIVNVVVIALGVWVSTNAMAGGGSTPPSSGTSATSGAGTATVTNGQVSVIYKDSNCTGEVVAQTSANQIGTGVFASGYIGDQYNDSATSVWLASGYTETWFDNSDYTGGTWQVGGNGGCQNVPGNMNDKMSSYKVWANGAHITTAGYCQNYANAQDAMAKANADLGGCGNSGGRWSNNYQGAYEWCITQPTTDAPESETKARAAGIIACVNKYYNW
jgi:hypothetical protein